MVNQRWSLVSMCLALLLLAAAGCAQRRDPGVQPPAAGRDAEFGKLVIRSLGIDGRACQRDAAGDVYCLSRTAESPRAITASDLSAADTPRVMKGLFLCRQQAGTLGGCAPTTAQTWDCDHYGPGPKNCHCSGIDGCIALSTLPTCEGGSCGNCSVGDCCCTAP
jgi:hypothetical protein